jgi:hypothetical protein
MNPLGTIRKGVLDHAQVREAYLRVIGVFELILIPGTPLIAQKVIISIFLFDFQIDFIYDARRVKEHGFCVSSR